jgi:hypothetical protein
MSSHSDHTLPPLDTDRLLATAGGLRLIIDLDAAEAVGTPGAIVAVPGAQPWLRGLTVWRGRLHTVVDAGLLFGRAPAAAAGLIVLKGLGLDVALAVDDLPRRLPVGESADLELDYAAFAAHPAFRPGAATGAGV